MWLPDKNTASEIQRRFQRKLAESRDFEEAFELVKSAVYEKFKMHRAGLSLMLQAMPSKLGAYHILGSNAIVVNREVLAAVKAAASSQEEYNSYVFMVLAHEYLHSLGIIDENAVRQMTYDLCKSTLGSSHFATRMAKEDPSSIYPQLRLAQHSQFSPDFQLIRKFDMRNQSYIQ